MKCVKLRHSVQAFNKRKSLKETSKSGCTTRDVATCEPKQIRVTDATRVGVGPLAAKPRIVYPKRVCGSDKNRIATTK